MDNNFQTRQSDKLIFLGLILFLLGLAVGLMVPNMQNPRMALSAHLQGIMNGMFLMVLGLFWTKLILSGRMLSITFAMVVYGTFANMAAVIIAAMTGFGKLMPIAGGQEGTTIIEGVISFLLISLSLCMLAVVIIVLKGYYAYMNTAQKE